MNYDGMIHHWTYSVINFLSHLFDSMIRHTFSDLNPIIIEVQRTQYSVNFPSGFDMNRSGICPDNIIESNPNVGSQDNRAVCISVLDGKSAKSLSSRRKVASQFEKSASVVVIVYDF